MKYFALVLSVVVVAAAGRADVPGIDYVEDQIIISTHPGLALGLFDESDTKATSTGYAGVDNLIAEYGVTRIEPYYPGELKNESLRDVIGRMFVVTISDPARLEDGIQAFDNDPQIEFAEPNYINYIDYVPNDPMISSWYQLTNIEAYLAWDVIRGDSTDRSVIGIVDSGVYYDHPELEPNMWINQDEDIDGNGIFTQDDINGFDDDGNGYVDDVVGYDLTMNDPYPMEPIPWHGTHVAGCATMATDNAYGGAAVGWAARIMAVKVAPDYDPNIITHGYLGITYAADNGCNVINLSWGRAGGYSQGEQNVITAAYNAGVVVVAAAGNDNSSAPHWPAAYDHTVAVAATDINDQKAYFSNYGSWVDLSAPGVSIVSTWDHDSFTALDGTSMSSPVTAGTVCLLRAANPGWSVDQTVNHLLSTADNIDDLNPGYEGLLGSGRVNAGAALGRDILPRLSVTDTEITQTEDDGDGILNPSEAFELVVTISNAWADASNVMGTLRSDDDFLVTDSTASFGDIEGGGGSSDNVDSPFAVSVNADALVGDHQFTLVLTADNYATEAEITVYISLQQLGFPGDIPGIIESHPVIFDIDGDGSNEIVISANDERYYSFESDGSLTPGWPQEVGDDAPGGGAIGDLDGDETYEVVGASHSGDIYAWNSDGSLLEGFPYDGGVIMFATPSLGDIDGDGDLEIVSGDFGGRSVFVINHDGSDYPGWPYQGDAVFYGSAALADMDNDDIEEIIYCDFNAAVHVWNSDQSYVAGFPAILSGPIQASPAVADIDGDGNLNIAVATFGGDFYVLDNDGTTLPGWPVSMGSNLKSSPSLADVDLDGHLEIIFGDNAGNLNVLNSNGQPQSGFPISTGGSVSGSPVIGDIDGDGGPDIIIGSSDGYLYAYDGQGQSLQNFPIPTMSGGSISGSAAIADLDGDGDIEVIVGVRTPGNNLEVIDYKADVFDYDFPWPFFGNDIHRSAYYGDFVTGIAGDEAQSPSSFRLKGNYPNPFNANTMIEFSIPEPGYIDLSIFNVLGQRLRSFRSERLEAGDHEILWDGTDDSGKELTSGVYFYKLRYGGNSLTKRMVMVK